jgi:putative heme iron utilization protein
MRSNTKAVQTKIRKHILEHMEYKDLKRQAEELKKYRRDINTNWQVGKQLAEDGFFLVYTSDIEKFLNSLGINPTNKKYSPDKVFQTYTNLIGREVQNLLKIKR